MLQLQLTLCFAKSKMTLDLVKNKLLMREALQVKCQPESSTSEATFLGYKKRGYQNWRENENRYEKEKVIFLFKYHGCFVVGHKKYECSKNQKKGEKANIVEVGNTEEEQIYFYRKSFGSERIHFTCDKYCKTRKTVETLIKGTLHLNTNIL